MTNSAFPKGQFQQIMEKLDLIHAQIDFDRANDDSRYLSTDEAAQFLSVSKSTLYNLRQDGSLTAKRINRKLYFRLGDLKKLIEGENN